MNVIIYIRLKACIIVVKGLLNIVSSLLSFTLRMGKGSGTPPIVRVVLNYLHPGRG